MFGLSVGYGAHMTLLGHAEAPVITDEFQRWLATGHLDALQDEDPVHLFCCCSPNVSMCGEDASDYETVDFDDFDSECERCKDIAKEPCILCGYSPLNGKACACGKCSPSWS